jgi:hypothetical protein
MKDNRENGNSIVESLFQMISYETINSGTVELKPTIFFLVFISKRYKNRGKTRLCMYYYLLLAQQQRDKREKRIAP